MGRFATIEVGYLNGEVVCSPDDVKLYFLAEPNALQWIFKDQPPGAVGVQISFEDEPPFCDFGVALGSGPPRLVASGNRLRRGATKYTIRFFDGEGRVIAESDPIVHDEPLPPGWPEYP